MVFLNCPGVEKMGFLWSMKAEEGCRPGTFHFKKDIPNPDMIHLYVISGHVNVNSTNDISSSDILCDAPHERMYVAPMVRRQIIKHGKVRGSLYTPPGAITRIKSHLTSYRVHVI